MNIKQLIKALNPYVYDNKMIYGVSREFGSYRGYYEHLYNAPNETHSMSVVAFQNLLHNEIGTTYEGYKGGEFTMSEKAELFVAHYGRTGHWVVGVEDYQDGIRLKLADVDMNGL